ncbi:Fic family protein [Nocardioides sp. CN2-186]|uniref:Fic family protein n=1 Tax=Nocardioides tweenelious TaxID=3156607 RepID=UPI0032B366F7
MAPKSWVEHTDDTPIINKNVALLDAQMAQDAGRRTPFTLDVPREWHTAIHAGCAHVPRPEYIGRYRGEAAGHIKFYNVDFPPFRGAPHAEVLPRLETLEAQVQHRLETWDAQIPEPDAATLARLNPVIDGLAVIYATWLRIHPFADGNGRSARLLANWVTTRYWQPPILPGRPIDGRNTLVAATSPAIPENGPDYRPLILELRRRLRDARAAAASGA